MSCSYLRLAARRSSCASRVVRPQTGERGECESTRLVVAFTSEAITNQARRAQPSGPPRPAQPGAAGVGRAPARGPKGTRRAVSRRTTAGHQEPDGCRGERGACRRHLAVRDRAEGAGLVRDCAGAQPRPPPRAGPAAPWCGFGALAGSSTAWLSFVRTAPAAPVAAPPSRRSRRFQVAARDVATSPLP